MIALINKLYLVIILLSILGLVQKHEEATAKQNELEKNIQIVKRSIVASEKERKNIEDYYKNIDIKRAEIEEVALQIEKIQKKLPQNLQDSETVFSIRQIADILKIRDIRVTPGMETENEFYLTKNYQVEGVGTYLQFLLLFESLADSERILNIKSMDIIRTESKNKGRYEVLKIAGVVESYRYNPNYKEDRGIKDIEEKFNEAKNKAPAKRVRKRK